MYPSRSHPYYGIFVRRTVFALQDAGVRIPSIVAKRFSRSAITSALGYLTMLIGAIRLSFVSRATLLYCHFAVFSPLMPTLVAVLTRRRRPTPRIVTHVHGTDVASSGFRRPLARFCISRSDIVVAPSRTTAMEVVTGFGVSASQILVYPSGGVSKEFYGTPVASPDAPYLGVYIGNLSPAKGVRDLLVSIASCDTLRRERWLVAGAGPDRNYLLRLAADLGITEAVHFIGPVDPQEVTCVLNRARFLVFPTHRETLGLIGLEALAAGRPVVASAIGAIMEYVVDGVNGLLFTPGDTDDLTEKLCAAAELPAPMYEQFATNARRSAIPYRTEDVTQRFVAELMERVKGR